MSVIVKRTIRGEAWCVMILSIITIVILEVTALNGPNVCMVKQKYNITKRVKYRAPMSVRTYEWCFSMPPRCSKWNTEMRDLTRLETEERTAEVAVCCPGYKMRDVSCVPICPNGKTGPGCSEDCPDNKWGPNCIHECQRCKNGFCSPVTGKCECIDGWQGESCDTSMPPTMSTTSLEELLTTLTTKMSNFETAPKITTTSTIATSFGATVIVTAAPTMLVTIPTSTELEKLPTSISTTTPKAKETTVDSTSTKTTLNTTKVTSTTETLTTTEKKVKMTRPIITTTEITKLPATSNITELLTTNTAPEGSTTKIFFKPISTTTKATDTNNSTEPRIAIKVIQNMTKEQKQKEVAPVTETPKPLIIPTESKEFIFKTETTRKENIEPEHITAVMGDKGNERSSVDLISVISIAGGVMMAIITVAVIIVMIERCKKPRYEDVRKINDLRMQVMIDNNDVPPPYVRSIFHTPLPDPPPSEKCHYQPISTLDRNLKQFMRPVVVQTISPIMLENFRGILECHYDHLPRRSSDFGTIQTRSSVAPSINDCNELKQLRASVTESAIEAMKCEAKLDVIDSTTSEPLYAEIPCWRPPSEHAIEILNMNGEAVTEL